MMCKFTNIKHSRKSQNAKFGIKKNHRVTHVQYSLIRCVNMKWIKIVLWKIQSGYDSHHRRADGQRDRGTNKAKPVFTLSTSLNRGCNKHQSYWTYSMYLYNIASHPVYNLGNTMSLFPCFFRSYDYWGAVINYARLTYTVPTKLCKYWNNTLSFPITCRDRIVIVQHSQHQDIRTLDICYVEWPTFVMSQRDFIYLCHVRVEEWYELQTHF